MTIEQRWIDDYRSAGLVDWPDGLRDAITSMFRRSTRRMICWYVFIPIGVGIGIAIAMLSDRWLDEVAATILGTVVAAIGVGIGVLRGNDYHKERIKAKDALRCDRVERFELGQHVLDEIGAAIGLGLRATHEGIPRVLYVCPSASLGLQVDRLVLDSLQHVRIRVVHAVPVADGVGPGEELPLTDEEITEIRSFIRETKRHWKWLYLVYAALSVGFLLRLSQFLMGELSREDLNASVSGSLLWLVLTLVVLGPHRRNRVFLWGLGRDLRRGTTEVVEGHVAVVELVASGKMRAEPVVKPSRVRRLSVSGVWWEVDGTPAVWRRA